MTIRNQTKSGTILIDFDYDCPLTGDLYFEAKFDPIGNPTLKNNKSKWIPPKTMELSGLEDGYSYNIWIEACIDSACNRSLLSKTFLSCEYRDAPSEPLELKVHENKTLQKCNETIRNVNKIKGSKDSSVSGWVFNVTKGPWNKIVPPTCKAASWFGWSTNDIAGSISTTLYGNGLASIWFGNCCKNGTVKLLLNGKEISSAGPNSHLVTHFYFPDNSILELQELGYGIIRFDDFRIKDCEGK